MKEIPLILDRFPENHIELFKSIFEENGYFIKAATIMGSDVSKMVGDIYVYGDFLIASGELPRAKCWHLTSAEQTAMSNYEGIFISLLSRFSVEPQNWTAQEMSDHFFCLLNFWKGEVLKHKIKACASFYSPHDPSSFALYILSKHMKIPYVFIDVVTIAKQIRFVTCTYEHRNLLIRHRGEQAPEWASEIIKKYYNDINGNFYTAQPAFIKNNKYKFLGRSKVLFRKFIDGLMNGENLLRLVNSSINTILPKPMIFLKYSRALWTTNQSMSRLRWLGLRIAVHLRVLCARRRYANLCVKVSKESYPLVPGRGYIYFAAPLEPEASTYPAALSNRSVELMLRKLTQVIPSDVFIVFKANPIQFRIDTAPYSTFPNWMRPSFYTDIAKCGKILFVSTTESTEALIDRSIGVACINGTVGVEAAAKGKHVIVAAPMWYDSSPYVHVCRDIPDYCSAVDAMLSNPRRESMEKSPLEAVFKLNKNFIFQQDEWVQSDISIEALPSAAHCLINGLQGFEGLDARKWSL